MNEVHIALESLLVKLEYELKDKLLWQIEPPSETALSSGAPFCCDTLSFEQWLQFVYLVKFKEIINVQGKLPSNINVTPMAKEAFKAMKSKVKLLKVISDIDQLLSQPRK